MEGKETLYMYIFLVLIIIRVRSAPLISDVKQQTLFQV